MADSETAIYLLVKKSLTTSDTCVIMGLHKGGEYMPTKGSDRITVRFPEPLHSELLALARDENKTPSEIIREAAWNLIHQKNSKHQSEKP